MKRDDETFVCRRGAGCEHHSRSEQMKPEDVTPEMVAEKVLGWERHEYRIPAGYPPIWGGGKMSEYWTGRDGRKRGYAPDFTQPGPAMELLEAMRARRRLRMTADDGGCTLVDALTGITSSLDSITDTAMHLARRLVAAGEFG